MHIIFLFQSLFKLLVIVKQLQMKAECDITADSADKKHIQMFMQMI